MAFTLDITFAGMCLLVHDPTGKKLCILLPATGPAVPAGCEPVHPHAAALLYDRGYETAGGNPVGGAPARVDLSHKEVVFPGLPAAGSVDPATRNNLRTRRDVVDLTDLFGLKVARSLLTNPNTSGRVVSRLTLPAGVDVDGSDPNHGRGGRWKMGATIPSHRHMAIHVTWQLPVSQSTLEVHFPGMNGQPGEAGRVLHPSANRIELFLFHSEPRDIPTTKLPPPWPPLTGPIHDPAHHFDAYYCPLGKPTNVPADRLPAQAQRQRSVVRGTRVECILATAEAM